MESIGPNISCSATTPTYKYLLARNIPGTMNRHSPKKINSPDMKPALKTFQTFVRKICRLGKENTIFSYFVLRAVKRITVKNGAAMDESKKKIGISMKLKMPTNSKKYDPIVLINSQSVQFFIHSFRSVKDFNF